MCFAKACTRAWQVASQPRACASHARCSSAWRMRRPVASSSRPCTRRFPVAPRPASAGGGERRWAPRCIASCRWSKACSPSCADYVGAVVNREAEVARRCRMHRRSRRLRLPLRRRSWKTLKGQFARNHGTARQTRPRRLICWHRGMPSDLRSGRRFDRQAVCQQGRWHHLLSVRSVLALLLLLRASRTVRRGLADGQAVRAGDLIGYVGTRRECAAEYAPPPLCDFRTRPR